VAKHSDEPGAAERGGSVGKFEKGQMAKAFEDAVFATEPGKVVGPVETAFGFHVIRREPLWRGAQILVAYQGSLRAPPGTWRKKEDARKLAETAAEKLRAGAEFAAVAGRFSDDVATSKQGGELGTFAPGMLPPEPDKAFSSLKVGEVSGVVESPFGFHILKRLE
jgi:peptidyl-prolyl cis-trans isomerase SurA